VLVTDAREVLAGIDGMRARAKGMASGLAAELAVVVDVFFPMESLASVARDFREQFPRTPLRLFVEAPGAAVEPVIDGRASFGIAGSLPAVSAELIAERLMSVHLMMVATADHPLASWQGVIPRRELGGISSWS
jgi:DNA-binding transcriptional LysR family regulator